jgi:hypothetical protein
MMLQLVVVAVVGAWSTPAMAQDGEKAKACVNKGVDLAAEKQWEDAVALWLGSMDRLTATDQVQVLQLLGTASKEMGRLPEAWYYYSRYVQGGGSAPDALSLFAELEKQLAQTHGKVEFACEPEGATLALGQAAPAAPEEADRDGCPMGAPRPVTCPASWWFTPGRHDVGAEKAGYESAVVLVDVAVAGGAQVVEIELELPEPERPDGGETERDGGQPLPPRPVPPSRWLEHTLIWGGLALAAGGGVLHGVAIDREAWAFDHYKAKNDSAGYDDYFEGTVRPMEISAYALYGVGGAAVVTGIILLLTEDGPPAAAGGEAASMLLPSVLPGGAGVSFAVGF